MWAFLQKILRLFKKAMGIVDLGFAKDDDDADDRFKEFYNKDPFPEIDPALLNSADICDYVRVTGMIHPFYPEKDKKRLKSASYEMCLAGDFLYWKNGKEYKKKLGAKESIKIEKNSISYVSVDVFFRLPDYIALRFNLVIKHVHRGLLLGTGPLINPGFCGTLMIPLHNMTDNDYSIQEGEPLIGVEFTKISPNINWRKQKNSFIRKGIYIENQKNKNDNDFSDYMRMAYDNQPIASSLTETLLVAKDATKAAKNAETEARNAANEAITQIKKERYFLTIAALVVFITFWLSFNDLQATLTSLNQDSKQLYISISQYVSDLFLKKNDAVIKNSEEILELKRRILELEQRLNDPGKNKHAKK